MKQSLILISGIMITKNMSCNMVVRRALESFGFVRTSFESHIFKYSRKNSIYLERSNGGA